MSSIERFLFQKSSEQISDTTIELEANKLFTADTTIEELKRDYNPKIVEKILAAHRKKYVTPQFQEKQDEQKEETIVRVVA